MMPGAGRPVRDMTGIQGRFDFTLNVLGTETASVENFKRTMMAWDTIFSALQEQLGLRLASAKGPVENLTIEHAEKPPLER